MKKQLLFLVLVIILNFTNETLNAQVHYKNTVATQDNSSAIGQESVANADASFASGFKTTASGAKSTALGITSEASGVGSTTLGINNLAIGNYSVTIGSNLKAVQDHSIVIGSGDPVSPRLTNNQTYSLMVGFLSQYPTLFVGTSPLYNKTGSIAIGNVVNENGYMDPQAKLHIRADANEEAAVFIEPHSWDEGDSAVLYLGNKQNSIYSGKAEGIVYATQQNHIFTGGDVYIEDIDKGIIMKSPDGKCWRGTLDNSGSLQFTQLDACPGNTTSVVESKMSYHGDMTVFPNPTDHFITVKLKENSFSKSRKLKAIIIDQYGNEILSTTFNGQTVGFYTADLPVGSYFVKVTDGNHAITKQFVKK